VTEPRRSGLEPNDEIARLLAIQIRLSVSNQTEAILELSRAGFGPTRIAELLGTSPATAKVTVAKARKRGATSDG
jgi:DNA-binding NarL/FixJ family response regulator